MSTPHRVFNLSSAEPDFCREANRIDRAAAERGSPGSPSSLDLSSEFDPLAGSSSAILQLRAQIGRVAPYFRTALLTGELHCGEKAVARALHARSPLKHHPFLELTPENAEQRLARRGASDAITPQGMLFLPQPDRLPAAAQAALLRLLRELGSQAPRVVAFAERGLRPLVSLGGFSSDLADSLGALRLALPSLRERLEDLPELLRGMMQSEAKQMGRTLPEITPDLLALAMEEPWPGNLAQLHAAVEGLMQRQTAGALHAEDLRAVLGAMPQSRESRDVPLVPLDQVVQEHIRAVLFACNGNKLRAAEILGISRSTLYRMLDAQGLTSSLPASRHHLQMAG